MFFVFVCLLVAGFFVGRDVGVVFFGGGLVFGLFWFIFCGVFWGSVFFGWCWLGCFWCCAGFCGGFAGFLWGVGWVVLFWGLGGCVGRVRGFGGVCCLPVFGVVCVVVGYDVVFFDFFVGCWAASVGGLVYLFLCWGLCMVSRVDGVSLVSDGGGSVGGLVPVGGVLSGRGDDGDFRGFGVWESPVGVLRGARRKLELAGEFAAPVVRGRVSSSAVGLVDSVLERAPSFGVCVVPSWCVVPTGGVPAAVLGSVDSGVFGGTGFDGFLRGLPSAPGVSVGSLVSRANASVGWFGVDPARVGVSWFSTNADVGVGLLAGAGGVLLGTARVVSPVGDGVGWWVARLLRRGGGRVLVENMVAQGARSRMVGASSGLLRAAAGGGGVRVSVGVPVVGGVRESVRASSGGGFTGATATTGDDAGVGVDSPLVVRGLGVVTRLMVENYVRATMGDTPETSGDGVSPVVGALSHVGAAGVHASGAPEAGGVGVGASVRSVEDLSKSKSAAQAQGDSKKGAKKEGDAWESRADRWDRLDREEYGRSSKDVVRQSRLEQDGYGETGKGVLWDRNLVPMVGHGYVPNTSFHGGFSWGVSPGMLWSHGGAADFGALQRSYGKPEGPVAPDAAGGFTGGYDAGSGGGSGVLVDAGTGVVPAGPVVENTVVSGFPFDYDGRCSRLSMVETNNYRAFEENSFMVADRFSGALVEPAWLPESVREFEVRRSRLEDAVYGGAQHRAGSKKQVGYKWVETMAFLGAFGWARTRHLGQLFGDSYNTTLERLKVMESYGLVKRSREVPGQLVWMLTRHGIEVSGFDTREVRGRDINRMMVAHNTVLHHVASAVWGGSVDVLLDEDFPVMNRRRGGVAVTGDLVVPDRVINSSLAVMRQGMRKEEFVPLIRENIEVAFSRWEEAGGASVSGVSPEQFRGNEFMWALFPPRGVGKAYHVPDLVIPRPRGRDGLPNSVAVEVELAVKPSERLVRTLEAYVFDEVLFGEVVWVVQRPEVAKRIMGFVEQNRGRGADRIRVVPLVDGLGRVVPRGVSPWDL